MQSNELKRKLLDMLGEDKEFRHAVAGVIGYNEILDKFADLEARMDERFAKIEEEIRDLREESNNLRKDMQEGFRRHDEEFARVWQSIENLRKDMQEGFRRHDEEFVKLRQDMNEGFRRHDEEFARVWQSIENLRKDMQEGFRRHDEEFVKLRQDMNEGFRRHDEEFVKLRQDMQEGFKRMDKRLRYIESYIERTSLTLEEEARDVIEYRLRKRDLPISISRLELPDIEIDIYGVDTDRCIIGEVKTRASSNVVEHVDKDIEMLCKRYPQYLRKKVIKVIYAMQVTQDAIEEGEKRDIWIVTAKSELTSLKMDDIDR
ncbi:MAG: hypothetical protein QXO37_04510 [Candidatus Nitrosocaldaceae archaeon]